MRNEYCRSSNMVSNRVTVEETTKQRTRRWIGVVLGVAVLLFSSAVEADESDPLPAPKGTPREQAIKAYNEGVKLLRDKHYAVTAASRWESPSRRAMPMIGSEVSGKHR